RASTRRRGHTTWSAGTTRPGSATRSRTASWPTKSRPSSASLEPPTRDPRYWIWCAAATRSESPRRERSPAGEELADPLSGVARRRLDGHDGHAGGRLANAERDRTHELGCLPDRALGRRARHAVHAQKRDRRRVESATILAGQEHAGGRAAPRFGPSVHEGL